MSPADFSAYLREPHVAVIAVLRPDGAPYTVPTWFLWEEDAGVPPFEFGPRRYPGGHVWLVGTYPRVWCRLLMRDPRASLCIESGPPFTAHVEFDGECQPFELPGFDIWPIARKLAEKYVGRGDPANAAAVDAFFANMKTEPRLLFRMTPRTVRAIDMRVYRGKRADREYAAARLADDSGRA
jgi:hypothetical protein